MQKNFFSFLLLPLLSLEDKVFLYSWDSPGTLCVAQTSLELVVLLPPSLSAGITGVGPTPSRRISFKRETKGPGTNSSFLMENIRRH
jgi:hypothetical protein